MNRWEQMANERNEENTKVVMDFYMEYFRTPTVKELKECGGVVYQFQGGGYKDFLESLGFTKENISNVSYVICDKETDEELFIGTKYEVAYELDIHANEVWNYHFDKIEVQGKYIKIKPFTGLRSKKDDMG